MTHEDVFLAERYAAKAKNSLDRGIEFSLSFSEYKRLSKIKKCQYTSIEFCDYINGKPTDEWRMRTLDRVDRAKGYIKGNVVAVCKGVNSLKGVWENPNNPLTPEMVIQIINKVNKRLK
jgi:hypothetical protein